jgi:hypothetical protein
VCIVGVHFLKKGQWREALGNGRHDNGKALICARVGFCGRHKFFVGASLLAIAVGQITQAN